MRRISLIAAGALGLAGCFYPPVTKPLPVEHRRVRLNLPYDLAWDAVHAVIRRNGLNVQAENPNRGLIEAQGRRFSLREADCGNISSVVGRYPAEPGVDSSAVYRFSVAAHGRRASEVEIDATFNSPLHVPFHPTTDIDCISRGAAESRLLREILAEARNTAEIARRKQTPQESQKDAAEPGTGFLAPGRGTLLKP